MRALLPSQIDHVLNGSAARLGRGLAKIPPSESRPSAPCHEINVIFAVMHELRSLDPLASLHAHGTLAARGRVDLIAVAEQTAIAVATTHDPGVTLERLRDFDPTMYEVRGDYAAIENWHRAEERWCIALVTRYTGSTDHADWLAASKGFGGIGGAARIIGQCPASGQRESWLFWEARRAGTRFHIQ